MLSSPGRNSSGLLLSSRLSSEPGHSDKESTPNRHNSNSSEDIADPAPFIGLENARGDNDEISRVQSYLTADSRTLSRKMMNTDKLLQEANETDIPLPLMGGGRDYPPPLPHREQYEVSFDSPEDPSIPLNWSTKRKLRSAIPACINAFSITMASAMWAQASPDIMKIYHIGNTTAALGTSLFVLGFASGPVIFGPLSEVYGRKPVMVGSSLVYVCFSFAFASAKDIQTIMICRFFAGMTGSSSLVVSPAILSDFYKAEVRGIAITIFGALLFAGPMLGPFMGGFTTVNEHLGWRWTGYFCGIVAVIGLIACTFFLEESHHAIVLVQKAETLRRRTGNWGIYAPHEEIKLTFKEMLENNIMRPVKMLVSEPILLLITIYNAFVYAILYMFLTVVPLVFGGRYHFKTGVAELPYVGMFIGCVIGGVSIVLIEFELKKRLKKLGVPLSPETKLIPMMVGGPLFCIGLFWVGWTGAYAEHVHWIVPTIGLGCLGIGLFMVFLPCLTYIIDCYLFFAASALAGNTLLRSGLAAAFPLFSRQMFLNMKIQWAATLLGCFALVMIPVPIVFYLFGKRLRQRSKYAFDLTH